jgi:predicted esterase
MGRCNLLVCLLMLLTLLSYGQDEGSEAGQYTSQGMTAYSAGDYSLAIKLFKEAFLLRPEYSALAYNISCCYALYGEKDSAIAWLQKTFELGSYLFLNDEDLVSLHADVRYQKLARDAEMRVSEFREKEWKPVICLPAQYAKEKTLPVVIGLHGYGTDPVDFSRSIKSAFLEAGYVLCCPYGPDIEGTTAFGWGGYPDAEARILEAVQFLSEEHDIDGAGIVLFGFSQGGGMALWTGLQYPEIFSAIISVAGYYSDELNDILDHEGLNKSAVYMMIGENDFQLESNKTAERLMKDKGMRVKLVIYEGLGHAFPPNSRDEIRKALQWVETAE